MRTRIIAITALLIMIAMPAMAEVWTFGDSATHWDGWGTWSENKKDVIGIPDFSGGEATISGGNTLQGVSFFFSVDQYQNLYSSLTSGDLFINTDDDNAWNYVVRLNSDLTASVYEFEKSYTDRTAYKLAFANGDYRDYHPAWAKVWGEAIATGTWSGMPGLDANSDGIITISGLNISFDKLTLSYTVSCANDVVMADSFSQTPIPGAVWLLGSGLLGLIGMRRRARA
ncbi:MAG: hypothetical protein AB7E32_08335 [Desulfovibrio sp.]